MYSDALLAQGTGVRDAGTTRFVRGALLVLFTYVFVAQCPGGQVGYVELWNGTERLDRQPVVFHPGVHDHKLAQLDFLLKEPARSIEYRFFVNANVQMTLERVELFSGLSIPND